MRILFWVPYPAEGASNRFRVEQYLPYLRQQGISYTLHPFWSSTAYRILYRNGCWFRKFIFFVLGSISRILDIFGIAGYDIVFIHRESYPIGGAFFEAILSLIGKPVIFDFDDAIFLSASSQSNYFVKRFKKPGKVADVVKKCKYVIAGNSYLADFALRYNRSVVVIPTPIDTDKYCPYTRSPSKKIVIGWIGSATTQDFLNPMRDIFIRLSKQFTNIEIKIVGGDFSISCLPNVISKKWSLADEIEDLKTFDIGIMPMPDNDWTNGKCGFKAILYMSMGIACVCSPVGMNKEIVTDGINGFFASTKDEWFEKLLLLVKSPELRRKIGEAGRRTIEDRYSLRANSPKYLEVFNKVYENMHKKRQIARDLPGKV